MKFSQTRTTTTTTITTINSSSHERMESQQPMEVGGERMVARDRSIFPSEFTSELELLLARVTASSGSLTFKQS